MGATAATAQEKNRKIAAAERAFDRARDWYQRVTGALGIAREQKKALRVVELESEVAEASAALSSAAKEYETVTGVPAPLSAGVPQVKPGTVSAVRATNSEFRAIDDEVARCEREINRLSPQIAQIEAALARQGVLRVSDSPSNAESERVLDQLYPERVQIRSRNIDNTQRTVRDNVELQTRLFELKTLLEKTIGDWNVAREKRDAMFATFQVGR